MCAHENRRGIAQPGPRCDDVPREIDARITQAKRAQSRREPASPLSFVSRGCRNLGDRYLRPDGGRIARRDPRMRGGERPVCAKRPGVGEGHCGHE
jgi:hypothetical protein